MQKKNLHTLSFWNYYLNALQHKALTLAISLYNLFKKLHLFMTPMDVYPYAKETT